MNTLARLARHARLTLSTYRRPPSPPLLVLFINSICNMTCEHCFYWTHLNKRDDLTRDEIFALSESMGAIEVLNLSGGEPFLRREFAEITRQFIRHNRVRQIYVPTNGWYTDKTVRAIADTLREPSLDLFAVEFSLDGMADFHDRFRGIKGAFDRAMATYDALAELQRQDPRLRLHAISTATDVNVDEIRRLTTYLFDRCPRMDHHNLGFIRGDRKNPALATPDMKVYDDLYTYMRRLWQPRESGRYGSIADPMLHWAKLTTIEHRTQVVPCQAGKLTAVVFANGDVSVCELHQPLGNLRQASFPDLWSSPAAEELRASIAAKACHCTYEIALWPSVVYRPVSLFKGLTRSGALRPLAPLADNERARPDAAPREAAETR